MKKYLALPLLVLLLTGFQWLNAQKKIVYPPPTPPKEEPLRKYQETPRPIAILNSRSFGEAILFSPQRATLLLLGSTHYINRGIHFQAMRSGTKPYIEHSHFGFDPFVAEWANYDSESKVWSLKRRIESTVDTAGKAMVWTISEKDPETDLWNSLIKIDFLFNDQLLFEEKLFSYSLDNKNWLPHSKEQYKWNGEGKLRKMTLSKYIELDSEWHVYRIIDWWYLPNKLCDVVEDKIYILHTDFPPNQHRSVFTNDQDGNLSSVDLQKYDPREDAWKPQFSERYTVDASGRIATGNSLDARNRKSIMDYTLLNSWELNYPSSLVHEETSTGGFYALKKESQRISYYDNGNISELIRVVFNERYANPLTTYKALYTYDDRNRLTGIERFSTLPKGTELEPQMRLEIRY